MVTRRFHELDTALTTATTHAQAPFRSPAPTEEPASSENLSGLSLRKAPDSTSSRAEGADAGPTRAEWAGLRARCLAYCAWGLENPGHYRLLFESRATGHLGVGFEGSPGEATFTALLRAVAPLVNGDPHPAATSLWISLHGMVTLRAGKPGFPWPPIEDLVDRALRGLS